MGARINYVLITLRRHGMTAVAFKSVRKCAVNGQISRVDKLGEGYPVPGRGVEVFATHELPGVGCMTHVDANRPSWWIQYAATSADKIFEERQFGLSINRA
jgi:hypothetical protein